MKLKIIIDTREQNPLKFNKNVYIRNKSLKEGDYSIYGYSKEIVIERKSVGDFFSTFAITKNKKRVIKEFERLSKIPYWYLLIEGSYSQVKKGYKFSRANGQLIDYVMALVIHYGGHIIFANDRIEASQIIESTFLAFLLHKKRGFNIC